MSDDKLMGVERGVRLWAGDGASRLILTVVDAGAADFMTETDSVSVDGGEDGEE